MPDICTVEEAMTSADERRMSIKVDLTGLTGLARSRKKIQ
jgi:hypothetical protein